MAKPQRNILLIIVPCALFAGWLAFGDSVFSQKAESKQTAAEGADGKDHLQQAADSIVAVAKERVAAAKTDDEAIQRARLSDQALSIIGKLGEFDTTPQSDELLNSYRTGGHPIIVDAVIQLRLANELRNWEEMSDTATRGRDQPLRVRREENKPHPRPGRDARPRGKHARRHRRQQTDRQSRRRNPATRSRRRRMPNSSGSRPFTKASSAV